MLNELSILDLCYDTTYLELRDIHRSHVRACLKHVLFNNWNLIGMPVDGFKLEFNIESTYKSTQVLIQFGCLLGNPGMLIAIPYFYSTHRRLINK